MEACQGQTEEAGRAYALGRGAESSRVCSDAGVNPSIRMGDWNCVFGLGDGGQQPDG